MNNKILSQLSKAVLFALSLLLIACGSGEEGPITITIEQAPINNTENTGAAPTAQASSDVLVFPTVMLAGQVLTATDSDNDLNTQGYTLVNNVSTGSLVFSVSGEYTFSPNADFSDLLGTDNSRNVSFTYTASDDKGNTSTPVSVTITVQGSGITDTQAPSVPTSVVADNASSTTVSLSWVDSTDNVAVTGYNIFRNTIEIAQSTSTSFQDPHLAPQTTYEYTVVAFDAAGNTSAQSEKIETTTLGSQDTLALMSLSPFYYLDEDGDGIHYSDDNCPYIYNPMQFDTHFIGVCDYDEMSIVESMPIVDLQANHVSPYGAWFTFTATKTPRYYNDYAVFYSTTKSDLENKDWITQQFNDKKYLETRSLEFYSQPVREIILTDLTPNTSYFVSINEVYWNGVSTIPSNILEIKTQVQPDFGSIPANHPRLSTNQLELDSIKAAYDAGNAEVVVEINRLSRMGQEAVGSVDSGMINAFIAYHITGNPQDLKNGKDSLNNYRAYFDDNSEEGIGLNQFRGSGFDYLIGLDLIWELLSTEEKKYYLEPYVDVINKNDALHRIGDTDVYASGSRTYLVYGY